MWDNKTLYLLYIIELWKFKFDINMIKKIAFLMKYEENQFFKLLRMKYIQNIYSLSNNGISYVLIGFKWNVKKN